MTVSPTKESEVQRLGYESFLCEAVDDGLNVLGRSSRDIIYNLLESDYGIAKDDIPREFAGFSEVFRKTIGPGAETILDFIVRRFYSKLQVDPPAWKDVDEAVDVVGKILRRSS